MALSNNVCALSIIKYVDTLAFSMCFIACHVLQIETDIIFIMNTHIALGKMV